MNAGRYRLEHRPEESMVSDHIPAELVGGPHLNVSTEELNHFVERRVAGLEIDGRSVCLVVPDGRRPCPLPVILAAFHRCLHERAASLTAVIALGGRSPRDEEEIERMVGENPAERYPGMTIVNHAADHPDALVEVGHLDGGRVAELTDGRHDAGANVLVDRHVAESDVVVAIGPVTPHEVLGMSGGNDLLVPGAAGQDVADLVRWIGALTAGPDAMGTAGTTPARAAIDEAAALVPAQRLALCVVVEPGTDRIEAAAFGTPEEAWRLAVDVAAETHVEHVDEPLRRVLACVPSSHEDVTSAVGAVLGVEPAVADGGEVVLYAPHVTEVCSTYPQIVDIGVHGRDHVLARWDDLQHVPRGALAAVVLLHGHGSHAQETGAETRRVHLTLATQVPQEVCESMGVGYLDPTTIDIAAWRADEGTAVAPHAGDVVLRLR